MTASDPARRPPPTAERWHSAVLATLHHESPLGPLGLAASATGLCAVLLPAPSPRSATLPLTRQSPVAAGPARDAARWLAQAQRELDRYFSGQLRAFTVPLDLRGTPFQLAVWRGLCQIPFGATLSYGALAAAVGRPRASRAVGQANHLNPVAIVVPCHRVIGADGSLTGYGGGLDCKRFLLNFEAHPPVA
ncbi:MAG: methylated-DNA--[protein]-cysteine S-methyltransferase [Planctomycetaceae bacterium]